MHHENKNIQSCLPGFLGSSDKFSDRNVKCNGQFNEQHKLNNYISEIVTVAELEQLCIKNLAGGKEKAIVLPVYKFYNNSGIPDSSDSHKCSRKKQLRYSILRRNCAIASTAVSVTWQNSRSKLQYLKST
ncbi:hypothetical protein Glove_299g43 [Diversispora epigaea]|uniref:Uncharacterized protein n=1 Tax=Diversispora epigaea TaxID=1348612 RepID=A0A397I0R9_9GLOM|nr:hypothetical protein Glove_299g43 [Diversispora epigaea]